MDECKDLKAAYDTCFADKVTSKLKSFIFEANAGAQCDLQFQVSLCLHTCLCADLVRG